MEAGWQWRTSCALNGFLGGRRNEPLCSRAWRMAWQTFIDVMQILWRDPVHCEDVHIRWLAARTYRVPPIAGKTGPGPGY